MSDAPQPNRDDLLERYLDGLLDDAERTAYEKSLRGDDMTRRAAELQARIDASLTRLFHVDPMAPPRAAAMLAGAAERNVVVNRRSLGRLGWLAVGLASAAAIAWLVAGSLLHPAKRGINYIPRPLSDVYRESLANGFEPMYHCSEAERFADAFAHRQGQPLKLLKLPIGVSMLGLANSGGLSRDTTAMLCRVDGNPVMVFVDRIDADQPNAEEHVDKKVHVFRMVRDGLVFYEVTPLHAPRVVNFIVPVGTEGASELPAAGAAA
jgi:hypothetical protein